MIGYDEVSVLVLIPTIPRLGLDNPRFPGRLAVQITRRRTSRDYRVYTHARACAEERGGFPHDILTIARSRFPPRALDVGKWPGVDNGLPARRRWLVSPMLIAFTVA